jgi:hypothetical protein
VNFRQHCGAICWVIHRALRPEPYIGDLSLAFFIFVNLPHPTQAMPHLNSVFIRISCVGHDRRSFTPEARDGATSLDDRDEIRADERAAQVTSLRWWQERMAAGRRRRRPIAARVAAHRQQQQLFAYSLWREATFHHERES